MKPAAGRFSLPQLMLFVLLALGVASMHTLGHVGDTGHHPAPAVAADGNDGMVVQPHLGADQRRAGSDAGETPGHGLNLDLLAVCLAVLGAVGIMLWAARISRLRRSPARLLRNVWTTPAVGRGPPTVPIRLRLAVVSVSRT